MIGVKKTVSDMTNDGPLSWQQVVAAAESTAFRLYDGVETPHRSCGIAIAETFGLATSAYQALRRGGITGEGQCGAIKAGELVIGELLGDPDPTGAVTEALRSAILRYQALWKARVDKGQSSGIICNELTQQFADFRSSERHAFCTRLAASVAGCVAEALAEQGVTRAPSHSETVQGGGDS